MIVDAKSKAQGVKRDGCKMSHSDSVYTKLSSSIVVLLNNKKKG
jgi:hypothetical protein